MSRIPSAFLLSISLLSIPACDPETVEPEGPIAFRVDDILPSPWGLEVDACVLVNEPPPPPSNDSGDFNDPDYDYTAGGSSAGGSSSGGSSSGSDDTCTDPAGCVNPPAGDDSSCTDPTTCVAPPVPKFYPDGIGGLIQVPSICPDEEPRPTVTAATAAAAQLMCQTQFEALCDDLCACHGGVPTTSPVPTACADSQGLPNEQLGPNQYHCGCWCGAPD